MLYRPNDQENGQGLVEYALVLILIAVAVIAALIALAPQIEGMFTTVSASMAAANP